MRVLGISRVDLPRSVPIVHRPETPWMPSYSLPCPKREGKLLVKGLIVTFTVGTALWLGAEAVMAKIHYGEVRTRWGR